MFGEFSQPVLSSILLNFLNFRDNLLDYIFYKSKQEAEAYLFDIKHIIYMLYKKKIVMQKSRENL